MDSEQDLSNFDKAMKKRGFEVVDPKEPKNYFKKAYKQLGRYKTPKYLNDTINEFDIIMSDSWETEAQSKNVCWYLPRPKPDGYHGGMPLGAEKWLIELAEKKLGKKLEDKDILQPFAGMGKRGVTVDINPELEPDYIADAHNLDMFKDEQFECVLCDPPFSDEEASDIFETPNLKWGKWSSEAERVLNKGGILILYHKLLLPNPKPKKLSLVANVAILNRTWHLPRIARFYKKDF